MSARDALEALRQRIRRLDPDALRARLSPQGSGPIVIDVREADEWRQGHLPGARHLSRGFLELRVADEVPDRDREIVVYCQSGVRSLFAADTLTALGYENVESLDGGFEGWKAAGHGFETPASLDPRSAERYARHLRIPEVGEAGQARLAAARVAVVGAGGLGCPALYYLAAAGVGHISVFDHDVVDRSNLQRQILHADDRVGLPKADSARRSLEALNPQILVDAQRVRIDEHNAHDRLANHDVVVDGCDNFATRYAVNDACARLRLPNVHGSVHRFEGQVSVFWAGRGPCYRCLHPSAPPPELSPNCAEAGVLGVLPGVIGMLEATETLKLLLGIGDPLIGKLLTFDALTARFATYGLRADPACPACSGGDRGSDRHV